MMGNYYCITVPHCFCCYYDNRYYYYYHNHHHHHNRHHCHHHHHTWNRYSHQDITLLSSLKIPCNNFRTMCWKILPANEVMYKGIKKGDYSTPSKGIHCLDASLTAWLLSWTYYKPACIILCSFLRGCWGSHTRSGCSPWYAEWGPKPRCWAPHQRQRLPQSPLCHAFAALWCARRWNPCPLSHRSGWNLHDTNLFRTELFWWNIIGQLYFQPPVDIDIV